jgi:DNA-binding transcriptional MerR regulator
MPEPALTPLQDAAAEVGLHPSTVRRYIKRGSLKAWRRGGDSRTYVDLKELRRLLEFKPIEGG